MKNQYLNYALLILPGNIRRDRQKTLAAVRHVEKNQPSSPNLSHVRSNTAGNEFKLSKLKLITRKKKGRYNML